MDRDNIVQGHHERLFMFEVFVDRLNIDLNRCVPNTGSNLLIHMKIGDLSPFEIDARVSPNKARKEKCTDKENADLAQNILAINAGKSCMFSRELSGFIKLMKLLPMIIEVYRTSVNECNTSTQFKQILLYSAKVQLPECLIAQMNLESASSEVSSTPYVVRTVYDLYDSGGKHAAVISLVFSSFCFSDSIMTDISFGNRKFIFKDSSTREKFLCNKIPATCTAGARNLIETALTNSKKGVMEKRISPSQRVVLAPSPKLPVIKYNRLNGKRNLKGFASPPRIPLKDTSFHKLTTAEKLNDRRYRNLIYQTYPDEPTCYCLPKFQFSNPMVCSSGCMGPCCMRLRNPKIHFQGQIPSTSTYCDNNLRKKLLPNQNIKANSSNVVRLRGGGSIEEIYGLKRSNNAYTNSKYHASAQRVTRTHRLSGGGDYDKSFAYSSGYPRTTHADADRNVNYNSCKPRSKSLGGIQASCVCSGKQAQLKEGTAACSKAPCMGIDCLIRAFQEAQEFVDSIGKVPGLEGLGLMDPSESPFFGRTADKDYQDFSIEKAKEKQEAQSMLNRHCTAPCNTLLGKSPDADGSNSFIPYATTAPLSMALPRHTGVVREAIPSLPAPGTVMSSAKPKRKEDLRDEKAKGHETVTGPFDIELGPCGEFRCKSRLKKSPDNIGAESTKSEDKLLESRGKEVRSKKIRMKQEQHKESRGVKRRRSQGRRNVTEMGKIQMDRVKMTSVKDEDIVSDKGKGKHVEQKYQDKEKLDKSGKERFAKVSSRSGWPGPGGDRTRTSVQVSPQVMKYIYTVGNYYPGTTVGHRDCLGVRLRIPSNMGWLWNTSDVIGNASPGLGWKPGAIQRAAYNALKEAKAIFLENLESRGSSRRMQDTRPNPQRREVTKGEIAGTGGGRYGDGEGETRQQSTVSESRLKGSGRVVRREASDTRSQKEGPERQEGTSRSLRQQESRSKLASNPRGKKGKVMKTASGTSVKKTPVRRDGRDDEEVELPPTLHIHRKDGVYYVTMYPIRKDTSDEPKLEEPIKPLQFKIVKNRDDDSNSSSSTASDMEIEFSPPAAVNRYRKKPDVVHLGTQVKQQEIIDAFRPASSKKSVKKSGKKKK